MGGKQPGQEQEHQGQQRKQGIGAKRPAAILASPFGELVSRPSHLEGTRPGYPVPNHLHVAVDTVRPERDRDGTAGG
jgi:hypothetical protein